MSILRVGVLAAMIVTSSPVMAATPEEVRAKQVPEAMKILSAWENEEPVRGQRYLRLVYWTPADREPAPHYEKRLGEIFLEVRKFYGAEMKRIGFGKRSILLERGANSLPKIHLVKGLHPYSHYSQKSGGEIRKECLPVLEKAGINAAKETIIIFCNMSNWDRESRTIHQNSPYYAGGNQRSGNAWQVDSPILNVSSLAKKEPKIKDGQYGEISLGRYNSIFIGGIAHELGHALGLPHNKETKAEAAAYGTALMGAGNRAYGEQLRGEGKGAFITLAHALKLASHPMFSGSLKEFDKNATFDLRNIRVEEAGKSFRFHGNIKATPPVYAVLGYMNPHGGNDYDATTCTAIPDENGDFTLECAALRPGKEAEFAVVMVAVNGSASSFGPNDAKWKFPYTVAKDGTPDISATKTLLTVAPWYDAVRKGNPLPPAADPADSPLVREIHRRLSAKVKGEPPGETAGGLPLSSVPWKSAKVGWDKPSADVLNTGDGMFRAGGRVFAGGIMAHAPSRYEFQPGGKWRRLAGSAGVLSGAEGSVSFRILADGREIWSSAVLEDGTVAKYDISLEGVQALVLETTDGGDGNGSDWGLWLDPQLAH
ncbi:MAG: NPCBM/NEW2 domain-containing protein [Verrucomicrobiota bacterium]